MRMEVLQVQERGQGGVVRIATVCRDPVSLADIAILYTQRAGFGEWRVDPGKAKAYFAGVIRSPAPLPLVMMDLMDVMDRETTTAFNAFASKHRCDATAQLDALMLALQMMV